MTGPSLVKETCISAPNSPEYTFSPVSDFNFKINSSYNGIAMSGFAAVMKEGLLPFLVFACNVN